MTDPAPIDAVITWVDGDNPAHRARRNRYIALADGPLHENAVNPHRWEAADEILFCLRSIEAHAPWIRRIWIVTEGAGPDLSAMSEGLRARVRHVGHGAIFTGFEGVLPTFNSLAIESLLWRIPGLSERFLYFNDDVFLTAPLHPEDVFRGMSPVLRGKWVDRRALLARPDLRADPARFNHFMQINAAAIAGFDAARLFAAAHVVHPMRRSVMASLFDRHGDAFAANVGYRFRDLAQFLPQGLHNHACIAVDGAVIETRVDHLHIRSGQAAGEARDLLAGLAASGVRFLCVNDLPQLERSLPDIRARIEDVIAPAGARGLAGRGQVLGRGDGRL
ncbi:Stealth CR1 domain-containing protein [Jannaschia pohangensis]|uniref:Stealth protein CR1, conserved region 1 n=1 Tax=Jannaschia pohangensis TaxID=390807 RepID=A0A1I3ICK9_9RHOB|nr:Stealth CR1 domain-containing protein [Jannaschia pohangensis]SFI45610.1 Stealth protein CR1, conserved region 1 [Jannaschia pohangensis]